MQTTRVIIKRRLFTSATAICLLFYSIVYAQPGLAYTAPNADTPRIPISTPPTLSFVASPNDISLLLAELDTDKPAFFEVTGFSPLAIQWRELRKKVRDKYGLELGLAYTSLYQYAENADTNKEASGGDFDFAGLWKFRQQDSELSLLGFHLEQRHRYGQFPPAVLHEFMGSVVQTTSAFQRIDTSFSELWWEQHFNHNRAGFRIGKLEIQHVMNTFAFENQNKYFLSPVFSEQVGTAAPTSALAVVMGVGFSDHVYGKIGVADMNGKITASGFRTFHRGEYFKALELGYHTELSSPENDNFHIFLWHADASYQRGTPSGRGVTVVLQHRITKKCLPFIKLSVNEGGAAEFKKLAVAGVGIFSPFGRPYALLGIAAAKARPTEPEHGAEYIAEVFYRIQLTPFTQITPDVQFIRATPHEKPTKWHGVFSLRFRAAV